MVSELHKQSQPNSTKRKEQEGCYLTNHLTAVIFYHSDCNVKNWDLIHSIYYFYAIILIFLDFR